MDVTFKYKIGQIVYYKGCRYKILSRCYLETCTQKIVKYNLVSPEINDDYGYEPNVWEDDIKTIWRVK